MGTAAKTVEQPKTMNNPDDKHELIDLRLRAGFNSFESLAQATGLARSTVYEAERGGTINYSTAFRIVIALNGAFHVKNMPLVSVGSIQWNVRERKLARRRTI